MARDQQIEHKQERNEMMKTRLTIVASFLLAIPSLYAQENPSDFVTQLPPFFTSVCSATKSEWTAYGNQLSEFNGKLQAKRNLALIQTSLPPNLHGSTTEADREFQNANRMISGTDLRPKFDKQLHGADYDTYMQKMSTLESRIAKDSLDLERKYSDSVLHDEEEATAEEKQAKVSYCKATFPGYLDLLNQERALLQKEINYVVAVDEAKLKFQYKWHPIEMSYDHAYWRIAEHLDNMARLLSLWPPSPE
jgi:hypothetical protein